MKKLNPNTMVTVDIVCRFPVSVGRVTLAGVYKSVQFRVSDLRMIIAGKAKVDRVLSNGKRVRVGFDTYDEDFETEMKAEAAAKVAEAKAKQEAGKKAAEAKSAPVKNVKEEKVEVKKGEAPKAEPVKNNNKK